MANLILFFSIIVYEIHVHFMFIIKPKSKDTGSLLNSCPFITVLGL